MAMMAYPLQQFAEMPPLAKQATPTYQAMSPTNNGMPNSGWNSGPGSSYRDSRQQKRNKPQWTNNRQGSNRHQKSSSPPASESASATATPTANTNSPAFQAPDGPMMVKLENLPHTLCRQNLLEAMLEQAGLTNSVMACVVGQEQATGCAFIYVSNKNAAQMCMEHFGGCSWDKSGVPVTARVMEGSVGQAPPAGGKPEKGSNKSTGDKTRKSTHGKVPNQAYAMNMRPEAPGSPMAAPLPGSPMAAPLTGSPMAAPCAIPLSMVLQVPVLPAPFCIQNGLAQHKVTSEDRDEGSTVAGSSGRSSLDTNATDSADPFACDTDDGF